MASAAATATEGSHARDASACTHTGTKPSSWMSEADRLYVRACVCVCVCVCVHPRIRGTCCAAARGRCACLLPRLSHPPPCLYAVLHTRVCAPPPPPPPSQPQPAAEKGTFARVRCCTRPHGRRHFPQDLRREGHGNTRADGGAHGPHPTPFSHALSSPSRMHNGSPSPSAHRMFSSLSEGGALLSPSFSPAPPSSP